MRFSLASSQDQTVIVLPKSQRLGHCRAKNKPANSDSSLLIECRIKHLESSRYGEQAFHPGLLSVRGVTCPQWGYSFSIIRVLEGLLVVSLDKIGHRPFGGCVLETLRQQSHMYTWLQKLACYTLRNPARYGLQRVPALQDSSHQDQLQVHKADKRCHRAGLIFCLSRVGSSATTAMKVWRKRDTFAGDLRSTNQMLQNRKRHPV